MRYAHIFTVTPKGRKAARRGAKRPEGAQSGPKLSPLRGDRDAARSFRPYGGTEMPFRQLCAQSGLWGLPRNICPKGPFGHVKAEGLAVKGLWAASLSPRRGESQRAFGPQYITAKRPEGALVFLRSPLRGKILPTSLSPLGTSSSALPPSAFRQRSGRNISPKGTLCPALLSSSAICYPGGGVAPSGVTYCVVAP